MVNQAAIADWLITSILGVVLLILVVGVLFWMGGAITAHRNIRKINERSEVLRKKVEVGLERGSRLSSHRQFSAMKANTPRRNADESRTGGAFVLDGHHAISSGNSCSGSSSASDSGGSCD